MKRMCRLSLSQWLYSVGAVILFVLAVVCMVAFIKAVCVKDVVVETPKKACADSLQVEYLSLEINELKIKVDSLILLSQKEPEVKYRYLKPLKDSCVIELNVNKSGDVNR